MTSPNGSAPTTDRGLTEWIEYASGMLNSQIRNAVTKHA
jgi:hypothetical protein